MDNCLFLMDNEGIIRNSANACTQYYIEDMFL